MRNQLLICLAMVAFLFSCSSDAPLSSPLAESANEGVDTKMLFSPLTNYNGSDYVDALIPEIRENAVTKKFKLRNSGVLGFNPNAPECKGYLQATINGNGNATHLGRFTIDIAYCSDGIGPIGPILGVQTAANGDELWTALVGAGFDPDNGPYMDFIYYGGTGRFENAYGEIRLFGLVDYDNLVFDLYGEGTLTY